MCEEELEMWQSKLDLFTVLNGGREEILNNIILKTGEEDICRRCPNNGNYDFSCCAAKKEELLAMGADWKLFIYSRKKHGISRYCMEWVKYV